MFKKYEKIFRILIPEIHVRGKFTLSKDETRLLLGGKVFIEEKMDGANTGIIRHKRGIHLQKRGSLVGTSEHEQFNFFCNWAHQKNYEKLMKLPQKYIVYGELMYAVHTIYYDKLPDYFLVFDIWNGQSWLDRDEQDIFCNDYEFSQVPLIAKGTVTLNYLHKLIPDKSAYGDTAEGIVVKRYRNRGYIRGKIVKKKFIKTLEESEHWQRYNVRRNKLKGIE